MIIMPKQDKTIEFIKKHFEFPSNNSEDIISYIREDGELEKIICDLPEIISKEFPQSPISLDFTKYSLSDEMELEISIKTPYDGETTSDKKDVILNEIFTNYASPEKYYFISMDF